MDELKDLCLQPRSVLLQALLAIQFPYTNFSLHKFQNWCWQQWIRLFLSLTCFTCKNGKSPDRIANLQPLSLLESYNKILTRILTARLATALNTGLYSEQHGFHSGRSCQMALLPVLEAINDATVRAAATANIIWHQNARLILSHQCNFWNNESTAVPYNFCWGSAWHSCQWSGLSNCEQDFGEKFDVDPDRETPALLYTIR